MKQTTTAMCQNETMSEHRTSTPKHCDPPHAALPEDVKHGVDAEEESDKEDVTHQDEEDDGEEGAEEAIVRKPRKVEGKARGEDERVAEPADDVDHVARGAVTVALGQWRSRCGRCDGCAGWRRRAQGS